MFGVLSDLISRVIVETEARIREDAEGNGSSPVVVTKVEAGGRVVEGRSSLICVHHEGILREAGNQKLISEGLLRGKLTRLNEEIRNGRERGKDAESILSKELWTMVIKNVTESGDLANCSRTCRLFRKLVGGAETQYLFEKVIQTVSCYLKKPDILHCRQVCKRWRSGVDHFLESSMAAIPIDQPLCDIVDHIQDTKDATKMRMKHFEYVYHFSLPPKSEDRIREIMKAHSEADRNPFIGRCAVVSASSPERPGARPGFFQDFQQFLSDFGQQIYHLNVTGGMSISIPPSSIYSLSLLTLLKCENLRNLHLSYWDNCAKWSQPEMKILKTINTKPPPPNHPHLEYLNVDIGNPKVLIFQDKLVEKYSAQLKRLDVHFWNPTVYHTFSWNNLCELQVFRGNSTQLLISLNKIRAPCLKKLSIRLDGNDPNLRDLIQLQNNLTMLSHLDLKCSSEFPGFSDNQIKSLTPAVICPGGEAVTSLELTISNIDQCALNFLICFPFLKSLVLKYGPEAGSLFHLDDSDALYDEPDGSDVYSEDEPESYIEGGEEIVKKIKVERRDSLTPAVDQANVEVIQIDDSDEEEEKKKSIVTNGPLVNGVEVRNGITVTPPIKSEEKTENFIQISKYFPEDWSDKGEYKLMYLSNVWEILPYLRTLKVCHLKNPVCNEYICSRQGYLNFNRDKKAILGARLLMVRREAELERKIRKKLLKKRLREIRAVIDAGPMQKGEHAADPDENAIDLFSDEIFPKIYNYLERQEILNLRLVRTDWTSKVNSFLERYLTFKDRELKEAPFTGSFYARKEYQFEYTFRIPSCPNFTEGSHDRFLKNIKLHARNALIGRTVTMAINHKSPDTQFDAKNSPALNNFLEHLGQQIWHVHLCGAENQSAISPSDYQFICLEILKKCPNLRRLTLNQVEVECLLNKLGLTPIDTNQSPELEEHSHLETLEVSGDNMDILRIQDMLIEKYSGQLKCVGLFFWNPILYHQYPWTNLKELLLISRDCHVFLDSLAKMEAPNLTGLYITLDDPRPKLEILIRLTKRFPKLDKLALRLFEGDSGLSCGDQAVTLTSDLSFPGTLTTLELMVFQKCDLSFDFLIYFLNLKRLSIQLLYDQDKPDVTNGESKSPEFIDIVEYYQSEDKAMYKSNVWTVLPSLEVLDFYRKSSDQIFGSRYVYTRQEWDLCISTDKKEGKNGVNGDCN